MDEHSNLDPKPESVPTICCWFATGVTGHWRNIHHFPSNAVGLAGEFHPIPGFAPNRPNRVVSRSIRRSQKPDDASHHLAVVFDCSKDELFTVTSGFKTLNRKLKNFWKILK